MFIIKNIYKKLEYYFKILIRYKYFFIVGYTGKVFIYVLEKLGEKAVFLFIIVYNAVIPPFYFKNFKKQFIEILFFSIPVVGLTALFTGMVLVIQSYIGFARFSAESIISSVVVLSITRELGPVLTALMVAGRVAGSIAAEIGTMKVSEQLDALYTMSVNHIKYLVVPRVLAGLFALPILVFLADIIGIMGGFLIATFYLDFNASLYIKSSWNFVTFIDITSGMVKGAVFGVIVTLVGSFYGCFSSGGARGVGISTTNAVVVSYILIFVFDYVLTLIFFNK